MVRVSSTTLRQRCSSLCSSISAQGWPALPPRSVSLLTPAAPGRAGPWLELPQPLVVQDLEHHAADGAFSPVSFRAREVAATVLLESSRPCPCPGPAASTRVSPRRDPTARGTAPAPRPLFHGGPGRSVPIATHPTPQEPRSVHSPLKSNSRKKSGSRAQSRSRRRRLSAMSRGM